MSFAIFSFLRKDLFYNPQTNIAHICIYKIGKLDSHDGNIIKGSLRFDPINYLIVNGNWHADDTFKLKSWDEFYSSSENSSLKAVPKP